MTVLYKTTKTVNPRLSAMKHHATLTLAIFLAIGTTSSGAAAQETDPMEAIQWLVGEWEGEGWMHVGRNGRQEFKGSEKVEGRLDRSVLIVEGRHSSKDAPPNLIHHALAVVSYDHSEGAFRFQAYAKGRPATNADANVEDGAFVWSIQTPGGRVRYRVRQTENGEWHEVGERSVEPEKWVVFFEMTLLRVR